MGELDDPVVVEFPLRGEWTVEQTPAHRIPSHGTDVLGMRYAYDFIRTDDRSGAHVHPAGALRWALIGGRTSECYGWGEPVHAAAAGEVVTAVDDVPERGWVHPARESWAALRTALAFRRSQPAGRAQRLAGNHVIVRATRSSGGSAGTARTARTEVFALYAHLVRGSVAATPGQQVAAGEVIGQLGHSGNSTAPHLHFQLMDSADAPSARGIPCAFAAYSVRRDGRWEHVRDGIPARLERLRAVP